jgi:hypothetical protein
MKGNPFIGPSSPTLYSTHSATRMYVKSFFLGKLLGLVGGAMLTGALS